MTASGATTICSGGSATLTAANATGGSGAYTSYVWSPGGATGQSVSVSPASTTTYTVTVTDSGGCTAISSGVIVTVNNCTPPNTTGIGLDQYGNISLTVTGAVGTVWSLRTNNNVAAPLPWPNMTNGTIPSSPFTVLTVPPANYPQRSSTISPIPSRLEAFGGLEPERLVNFPRHPRAGPTGPARGGGLPP